MRSRRRYATKRIEVEVDVDDIIAELDTDELIKEIEARASGGDREAQAFVGGSGPTIGRLGLWDSESLLEAVRRDDGQRAVDLLREAFR